MTTTPSRPATRPHPCPHCRCIHADHVPMGFVDKTAPFYPLVQAVLEATS